MRRFDIMNLAVYIIQLLLFIPCFWLMMPLSNYFESDHHWPSWAAFGLAIIVSGILWLAIIILLTYIILWFRRRKQQEKSK